MRADGRDGDEVPSRVGVDGGHFAVDLHYDPVAGAQPGDGRPVR
jgi:hypothetical protein